MRRGRMDPRAPRKFRIRFPLRVWQARRIYAHAGSRSRSRTREPCASSTDSRSALEAHPRLVVGCARREMAMPHFPHRLPRFVFANINFGAAKLAAAGKWSAAAERDREIVGAGKPSDVAANLYPQILVARECRLRFRRAEEFPQLGPFLDPLVRVAVEIPAEELVAADERLAHHRDTALAIRIGP